MMGVTYLSEAVQIICLTGSVAVFFIPLTERRGSFAVRAAIGAILILGTACFTACMKGIINEHIGPSFGANALFVVLYYVQLVMTFVCCEMCFKGTLCFFMFVYAAGASIHNIVQFLFEFIKDIIPADISYYWLIIYGGVLALILVLVHKLLVPIVRSSMGHFENNGIMAFFYFALCVIEAVVNIFMLSIFQNSVTPYLHYMSFAVIMILNTVYFLVQFGYFQISNRRQDNEMLEAMLHEKEKQYEISRRNMELVNIKSHDLKRQLEALRFAGSDERSESLDEMRKVINDYDSAVNTDSQALNIILTEKSHACDEKGITFSCIADGAKTDFMNSIDLYSMLGNALDNAIESVEKLPEDKKFVSITIKEQFKLLSIQVMNYFNPDNLVTDKAGGLVTSKGNSKIHGFGSKSIRNIAEKYGGSASRSTDGDIFTLQILIPISGAAAPEPAT